MERAFAEDQPWLLVIRLNSGVGLVSENLDRLEARVQSACDSVGRKREEVTVVCVSKTVGIDAIAEAYEWGVRDFGESRLQELQTKVHHLPSDIRWHFLGKIQSNKVRKIVDLCQVVHSLEKESQWVEMGKQDRTIDCFLQLNLAKEQQKSGIFVEELDRTYKDVIKCLQVRLIGLMTIGPLTDDPEDVRLLFRELASIAKSRDLKCLSMGMSGDFDVAIQEGSTHVRVGSAVFGQRS